MCSYTLSAGCVVTETFFTLARAFQAVVDADDRFENHNQRSSQGRPRGEVETRWITVGQVHLSHVRRCRYYLGAVRSHAGQAGSQLKTEVARSQPARSEAQPGHVLQ